jgi:hypothetical protein
MLKLLQIDSSSMESQFSTGTKTPIKLAGVGQHRVNEKPDELQSSGFSTRGFHLRGLMLGAVALKLLNKLQVFPLYFAFFFDIEIILNTKPKLCRITKITG